MLKFILFALFVTVFCACEDHGKSKAEDATALDKGLNTLRFKTGTNSESLQNVEITLFGATGLYFWIKPNQETARLYFHSTNEVFNLSWLKFEDPNPSGNSDARLSLNIIPETSASIGLTVCSDVFTRPKPGQAKIFQDGPKNAVHVQLMAVEEIDKLLQQNGNWKVGAILSISWIKDLFAKKELEFDLKQGYIGPPVIMDTEVRMKLARLRQQIKDAVAELQKKQENDPFGLFSPNTKFSL